MNKQEAIRYIEQFQGHSGDPTLEELDAIEFARNYLDAQAKVQVAGEWHSPGIGEVHNKNHSLMIYCMRTDDESPSGEVMDDDLAKYVCAALESFAARLSQGTHGEAAPIPMMLFCPKCGEQHIDAPDDTSENEPYRHPGMWNNPPHRSHLCHTCGCIWRPSDVATTGVKAISTKGKADNFSPAERAAVPDGMTMPGPPYSSQQVLELRNRLDDRLKNDDYAIELAVLMLDQFRQNLLTATPQSPKDARAVDGLTAQTFGEWCNTLTHAHMYITERMPGNAKYGIECVLKDLREWQRKFAREEDN